MPSPGELEQFMSKGFQLSQIIEGRLEVQHATWVHPQDLAIIGLAVYGGEGQDTKFMYLQPKQHAREISSSYRADTLQRFGLTQKRLEQIYPELTGNGDYSKGAVANALKRADKVFNPGEFKRWQFELGGLLAVYAKMRPNVINQPNIRLDVQRGSVRFSSGVEHPLTKWPNVVIEYGPGAAAYHKIPSEVRVTPQNIFIENNYFINQFLFSAANIHGIGMPQVITRMDGIKAATTEFLSQNPEGLIDIVIMSMVHSAGEIEIEAGIRNAHRLLRLGGLLAVQAVEQVQQGEATATFAKQIIADTFSASPLTYHELTYMDPVRRTLRDIFQAVYVK